MLLALRPHKLLLQPLVHFLRPPQRRLHVVTNIFLSDNVRELRLMNQLRRLLASSTQNQRALAGVQLLGDLLDGKQPRRVQRGHIPQPPVVILRLRNIFDLAGGNPPLLFLLDELLQGTNSSDRRIGADGIVRALVNRGAIGLVSTHDLALTDIGGSVAGQLRNVHFEDDLENGKMTFDYKLRDGVVTKSNGLELMRSIVTRQTPQGPLGHDQRDGAERQIDPENQRPVQVIGE